METVAAESVSIIAPIAKSLAILFILVGFSAFLTFIERRLLALWQDRYGPNRAGPFGLLQIGLHRLSTS
jgi:NADH-quinone oxidoreductase subunit H